MLSRLAVEGVRNSELESLESQLMTEYGRVDATELDFLYQRIPAEFHYEGPLYRGFRVTKKDLPMFLDNKQFWTRHKEERAVESWTDNLEIAFRFANQYGYIGVVLESNTSELDVVMRYNPDIFQVLEEYFEAYGFSKRVMKNYALEYEIMVRNPGERKYTLCKDVVYLIAQWHHLNTTRSMDWKKEGELLKSHMAEDTVQFVENTEQSAFLFKCDGAGRLEVVRDWNAE